MVQRLEPLLREQTQAIASKKPRREDRRWTHTHIIKALRSEEMSYDGVKFTKHSEPTAEQARLLALLREPKDEQEVQTEMLVVITATQEAKE